MPSTPYMKIWVADIVASCNDMSAEVFGIHMRMILYSWDRGYCPSDPKKLKSITNCNRFSSICEALKRWQRIKNESISEDVYIHPRVELERNKMLEYSAKMTERSKKGNDKRWSITDNQRSHGGIPQGVLVGSLLLPLPLPLPVSIQSNEISEVSKELNNTTGYLDPTTKIRKEKSKSKAYAIQWTPDGGFTGITDDDRAKWKIAFPDKDLDFEMAKMSEWLIGRPTQARKSLWRAFMTRWLSRSSTYKTIRQDGSTAFKPNLESNF